MLGYIISDKKNINVEEHEIQSLDILHKTDLNVFIVHRGYVLFSHIRQHNTENNIYCASIYGYEEVLEWYKNSGYEFNCDEKAINGAASGGHVKVLEWYKNSGYEFKYTKDAIVRASENGHFNTLKWFKNSGYKFKYNKWAIYYAVCRCNIKMLEFFKNYNVKKFIKWSIVDRVGWSKNYLIFSVYKFVKFMKRTKYKTKNNYIKGYNKN